MIKRRQFRLDVLLAKQEVQNTTLDLFEGLLDARPCDERAYPKAHKRAESLQLSFSWRKLLMTQSTYNPDVLNCLANLNNDEVFTPPEVANAMLDMLPQKIFADKNATFLDPACKSGVFLREIAKRLVAGLEKEMPDLHSRRSVYCSKDASGKYSVPKFARKDGNIFYQNIWHTWQNGKCLYCGANEEEYGERVRAGLESYAYQFIHNAIPEEIENMKFDVIIGNPPYQLSDGGAQASASPIYHYFIQQAKKLNPKFLAMIIPARWFAGGMGLDEFRKSMLNDRHITTIVDYPNSDEVFSGVDISGGVCYFLWERDRQDDCKVTNIVDGKACTSKRPLNEFITFVRYSESIPIIRKVFEIEKPKKTMEQTVSPQRPFGLPTNYAPKEQGVPCWFIQKIGLKFADEKDIDDPNGYLNKWKLIVPKAPIAGQTDFTKPVGFYYDGNTRIARPGECCTESFIVAGAFDSKEEVLNFKSYLFTKIVRFLLLQTVISQDVLRNKFCFVPALDEYNQQYTDDILKKRWNITELEWSYIDSKIYDISANR